MEKLKFQSSCSNNVLKTCFCDDTIEYIKFTPLISPILVLTALVPKPIPILIPKWMSIPMAMTVQW